MRQKKQAKQVFAHLGVYSILLTQQIEVYSSYLCTSIAFFPNLLRMLSAAPHCFVVLLAVQLVQGSPQHSGTEEEHSISEGFSNHITCSWNCRVTESDFTKQCDPVFTKKRLITFNVLYDLEVNKKCFNHANILQIAFY